MRVLWTCNIVIPELAKEIGIPVNNTGGWLSGTWNVLKKDCDLELCICVPIKNLALMKNGRYGNYEYYSFPMISPESETTIEDQIEVFDRILDSFKPDVIQINGTEFEHSYSMVEACKRKRMEAKIIVNIQGLLTFLEKVYIHGVSNDEARKKINGNSLLDDQKDFLRRSVFEKKVFGEIGKVFGRTEWDKACTDYFSPNIRYFHCGDILRPAFYNYIGAWDIKKCNKYSIFMSQAGYPIKGLHLIIEEISRLKDLFPELKMVIAGTDLYKKENAYAKLIRELIDRYKLRSVIEFVGPLKEEQMISYYLGANVFLSPSILENGSNSVCEAMLLGVPVVASYVGGVTTTVEHNKSGFLFPLNEPYRMSAYIRTVFENEKETKKISAGGIERARDICNRETIKKEIIAGYEAICDSSER